MQHFVLGLAPSTALTLLWVEKTEVLPGPQRRGSGGRSLECCHLCIMRGRQGDVHTLSATGGLPGRHGVWGGSQARRLGSRAWGRGSRREGAGPPEVRHPPPRCTTAMILGHTASWDSPFSLVHLVPRAQPLALWTCLGMGRPHQGSPSPRT